MKKMSQLLPSKFHDVWRSVKDKDKLNIVCKGGRGSGKSSDISIMLTLLIMKYPANALVMRKTHNSLESSVYEQMKWAINEMEVGHLFKFNKSPLKITYLPRGNHIAFRGGQDPSRLKSLKDAKFPYTFLWIEELAEFKSEDEVKMIVNSILRGELPKGLFYKFFFSYNPPKHKQSWVNKKYESVILNKNTYVHHSTYFDNPYISSDFIEEALGTKEISKKRYDWEYMGKAIGSGVTPFENLEFRTITDDEVARFDNIRQGNDFGYANDALAFVRWHYDKKHRVIYAIDEIYGVKISNRELAKRIKERGYDSQRIACDSAEPKSIDELRHQHGVNRAYAAKKSPDSREYGERWLDDLVAIVIDPKRTPNIAREFESADYAMDRYGNPLSKLEEKDDHTIDATRYAFGEDMKQPSISFW